MGRGAPARFGAARLPAVGPGLAFGFGGASGGDGTAPGPRGAAAS